MIQRMQDKCSTIRDLSADDPLTTESVLSWSARRQLCTNHCSCLARRQSTWPITFPYQTSANEQDIGLEDRHDRQVWNHVAIRVSVAARFDWNSCNLVIYVRLTLVIRKCRIYVYSRCSLRLTFSNLSMSHCRSFFYTFSDRGTLYSKLLSSKLRHQMSQTNAKLPFLTIPGSDTNRDGLSFIIIVIIDIFNVA